MKELLYILAGVLASSISYFFLRSFLKTDNVWRENYRGKRISTLGGIVGVISVVGASAVIWIIPNLENSSRFPEGCLFVGLGFALLGILDDLCGDKTRQGFKGHLASVFKGKITTGSLKLFGGPLVAFAALGDRVELNGYWEVIVAALVIALSANLANLFDMAPGRSSKYCLVAILLTIAFADSSYFIFLLVGILVVSTVLDLREKFMLGDTGSNFFGAVIGYVVISSTDFKTNLTILVVLVTLNLLSEFISFSKIIHMLYPLRLFDYIGQTNERISWEKSKSN